MFAFERMWSKLPECLKSDDIKKYYIGISEVFDLLESEQTNKIYTSVLSKLEGGSLDVFGECHGVKRRENSDATYKTLVLLESAKSKFVPTLDNYMRLVQDATGHTITVIEGWGLVPVEKVALKIFVTVAEGIDYDFFTELDTLCGAGVKLIIEYVSKVPGVELLNAQVLINHDTIKIGGE
ncbi:MAG: hypothetical protein ACRC6U_09225 [Fusobacteriaceae bacterium]